MSSRQGVLTLVICLIAGCGDKLYSDNVGRSDPVALDAGGEGPVTYTGQIKPILDARCISCHASDLSGSVRNGAPPGFNYDTYAAAQAMAVEANEQIQSSFMPPGAPLEDSDKGLFQQWLDDGLLESDCSCDPSELLDQFQFSKDAGLGE